MGHTFDMECEECNQKFCQCHDYVYHDTEDGDRLIFCSKSCKEEHLDCGEKIL